VASSEKETPSTRGRNGIVTVGHSEGTGRRGDTVRSGMFCLFKRRKKTRGCGTPGLASLLRAREKIRVVVGDARRRLGD